jgi:hypothetical protein
MKLLFQLKLLLVELNLPKGPMAARGAEGTVMKEVVSILFFGPIYQYYELMYQSKRAKIGDSIRRLN